MILRKFRQCGVSERGSFYYVFFKQCVGDIVNKYKEEDIVFNGNEVRGQ